MPGRSIRSNSSSPDVPCRLLHLDRDAGVVADALPQAGEGVEQRRLAGVRVADEGDGQRAGEHEGMAKGTENSSQSESLT